MDQGLFSLGRRQLKGHPTARQCLWGGFGGDGARPFTEGYGRELAPEVPVSAVLGQNQRIIESQVGRDLKDHLVQPFLVKSKSCGGELGAPEVRGANKETSMEHLKGNKEYSTRKVTWPTAQMKCHYTNAHSMGNKQEELEATVLLESYDLVAITETWWDESHDWSMAIDGYRLFRRDRRGRRGGGVAFYIKKWIGCEELSLKNSHEQVESLWVRIRDQGNKGNLVVGVYYRTPNQGEPIDEAFFLQLQEASHLQALVLLGDFNHFDICWKSSMASCRQYGRLLECFKDNFLTQVIDTPTRGDAILDLMVTNTSELTSAHW
ncbi:hypothetical protein QYF61_001639 [Mycteria americana]|uniref:Endonuclease/exonuclease/phosphatase domain-containing protein n=1 Tax=Mycteria americana TaxID=33587 RepID=A0AAN7PNV4_MYCAM|nr:hypothetical protein QYF61_001639 [Mycteria americana]